MVLETGIETNAATQPQQRENHTYSDATVEDELELVTEGATTSGSVLFDKAYELMEKFASTRIGQFVLERGDRVLRIFEDTAKWSLPHDVPLERPLPWLPFLMLIIFLRQLRICLSLGALLIGNGPVTAHDAVYFIQSRRRKLRSIRVHGLKAIQECEQARKALRNDRTDGLMVKLGKLLTIAVCRPRINCEPAGVVFAAHKPGMQELLQPRKPPRFTYKRQREDDEPEAELSCSQLLSKYANESSDDDSDYVPIQEEEDTNNESTESAFTSNDTQGEYVLDTSDENAKGLSSIEKVETKETKSPKVEKLPAIEINAGEKENNSVLNNTNQNDKNNACYLDSDKSVTNSAKSPKSPKSPHTPLENGPKDNNEQRGLSVVVQTGEGLKAQKEHILDLLNGNLNVEKKSTPGHETAAETKPLVPPPLLSNVVNAITPDPHESNDGNPVGAIDDCFANKIEISSNVPPQPLPPHLLLHSSLSSPSCSTTSSTSSLASFETSNEYNFNDDGLSDPPTPSPSLNEASSSEDIYLSPFGSPPNFNVFHNPASSHKSVVAFGAAEDPSTIEDDDFPLPKAKQFKSQQDRKKHQEQQQKHSHKQRYRRNRR